MKDTPQTIETAKQFIGLMKTKKFTPKTLIMVGVGPAVEVPIFYEAFPELRIIGCDPHPEANLDTIRRCGGDTLRIAIDAVAGQRIFYGRKCYSRASSFWPRRDELDIPMLCWAITLDTLLDILDVSLDSLCLWMDCEGAESPAILGGPKTMAACRWLNIEISGVTDRPTRPVDFSIHRMLEDLGFIEVGRCGLDFQCTKE